MITGKKLRLAGKGEPSPYGGPPGDLYIQSKILDDPVFHLDDHDVHIVREVKITEAILGTNFSVPSPDGKELSLKIPPGTKHKTKMRIADRGLPYMRGSGKGDLFINIHVEIPKRLTAEQKKLIKKLAAVGL